MDIVTTTGLLVIKQISCTVPVLLHTCTFSIGKTEDTNDKLRSVLAQLTYAYEVRQWTSKGVPFSTKLHVSEVHPITKEVFCEREDEGHVLKVNMFEC